jgi:predicted nucleic acid-binding protein
MAVYFFDSSALVKRHVDEAGSTWVRSLTRVKAGHTLYIARLGQANSGRHSNRAAWDDID